MSISPADTAALTATPRSSPTTMPILGPSTGAGIAAKDTCQRPARPASPDDLAGGTARLQRNRTQPALGMNTWPQCPVQPLDLARP